MFVIKVENPDSFACSFVWLLVITNNYGSFYGLTSSINWPAPSVWVFMAQLEEHCSANAEATGSNPVETPKNFFRGTSKLLKLRFNWDGHIFISSVVVAVNPSSSSRWASMRNFQ